MSLTVTQVYKALDQKCPFEMAYDWDHVGLLVGDWNSIVQRALIGIDLSDLMLQKAQQIGAQCIILHHPCVFPKNQAVPLRSNYLPAQAFRLGINILVCHTNYDQALPSILLTKGLGVRVIGRFYDRSSYCQLVTYIPGEQFEEVYAALIAQGAGKIGAYEGCAFSVVGEGRFLPLEQAQPFVGTTGRFEKVSEKRLELIFPKGLKTKIVQTLKQVHPYEAVAYQLYDIQTDASVIAGVGIGLVGELEKPVLFTDIELTIKSLFEVSTIGFMGDIKKKIYKIGFLPGQGKSFVPQAIQYGIDLFITGEVDYHSSLFALRSGCAVVTLGHTQSEKFFFDTLQEWLSAIGLQTETFILHEQQYR